MFAMGIADICPPTDCIPKEIQAYRFTYEIIGDERNFIPVYLRTPRRFNDKSDLEKCSGFGISLYKSEEQAIAKYTTLRNIIQNISKTIGTHLAKGKIIERHGVITPVDVEGHFDLHESEECNLHNEFIILRKIA